ncbi:hypothetical protein LINGRAHAP2_LOCUS24257 [Linum grandiflorum]
MSDLSDEEFAPTLKCRGPLEAARKRHGRLRPTRKRNYEHHEMESVAEWTGDVTDQIELEVLQETDYEHLIDARTSVATLEAEKNATLTAIDASLDAAKSSCAYWEARNLQSDRQVGYNKEEVKQLYEVLCCLI